MKDLVELNEVEPPSITSSSVTAVDPKKSLITRITDFVKSWRSGKDQQKLRDTLEDYLDESNSPLDERELGIASNERAMLSNILKLSELTAEDVAVPRVDIQALDVNSTLDEILEQFEEHQHSRLPVFEDTLDEILGFVHIKDVVPFLSKRANFTLREILHTPLIVSPAMQVSALLLRMRLNRVHLALVVDEYGGIDGLITIEDLVEQIVGEIGDEHDDEDDSPQLVEHKGEWHVDARVTIEDFEEVFGEVLTEDERDGDIDTLGGLVMSIAGSVPTLSQVLVHEDSGLEFRITGADPRRVLSMSVKKSASSESQIKPAKG